MGFNSVARYARALHDGRVRVGDLKKVPSQASTAGWWVDLSMAAGIPVAQFYASSPLEAAVLSPWKGILHGDAVAPSTLHLTDWTLCTPTAALVGEYRLLDYLLYYPFVDGDSLDEQPMVNGLTLPRYADGDGVQVMAVAVAPTNGGGSFTFNYVNHNGDLRTSPLISCTTASCPIASLLTGQQAVASTAGPFLPLTGGCRGVRQITSVTMAQTSGGLFALVLVKPLATSVIREINTPREIAMVTQRAGAPRIVDGAYLNLVANVAGTVAAGTLSGHLKFCWDD